MAMIRELTQHLLDSLLMDNWPRPGAVVDFGIDTSDHLGALQYAYKHAGRTPEEFDAALGSGAKLTELCTVPGQPYVVKFETSWDRLPTEEELECDDENWEDQD